MKLLSKSKTTRVYRDGDSIVKMGPKDTILWEAKILEKLTYAHGVPHLRNVTTSMGSSSENMVLIMDSMPGIPATNLAIIPPEVRQQVWAILYSIVTRVYTGGIAHMRLVPENILVDSNYHVSLVGFGKARILRPNTMDLLPVSPDFSGQLNPNIFTLEGPVGQDTVLDGSFRSLCEYFVEKPMAEKEPIPPKTRLVKEDGTVAKEREDGTSHR